LKSAPTTAPTADIAAVGRLRVAERCMDPTKAPRTGMHDVYRNGLRCPLWRANARSRPFSGQALCSAWSPRPARSTTAATSPARRDLATLPLGVRARLDASAGRLEILESGVSG